MELPVRDLQRVKVLYTIYRIMWLVVIALSFVLVRPIINVIIPMEYFIVIEPYIDQGGEEVDLLIDDGTVSELPNIHIKRKIVRNFKSDRFIQIVDVNTSENKCIIPVRDITSKAGSWMERTFEFERWLDYYPTFREECKMDPGSYVMLTDFEIPWWFGSEIKFTLTSNVFEVRDD